jgi:hypothetical protein
MAKRLTHHWHCEILPHGGFCQMLLNGDAIYPVSTDIHLSAAEPSEIVLQFPQYGTSDGGWEVERRMIRGVDSLLAEGTVGRVYVQIGETRYQLVKVDPGEPGLFGEKP